MKSTSINIEPYNILVQGERRILCLASYNLFWGYLQYPLLVNVHPTKYKTGSLFLNPFMAFVVKLWSLQINFYKTQSGIKPY